MGWKKICVLGAGSYGKVYYAIKINSPSSLICAEVAAVKCADIDRSITLQQEAQILTTLKGCPYVVKFFGEEITYENDDIPTYNLFLEYACGGSLHDLIINSKGRKRRMSELEVGLYTYQLLKGIQHVHSKGWIHCDIKPENILVFDNERDHGMQKLKLADFGLSLEVGEGMALVTRTPLSNRGTLLYAPPESLTNGYHSIAYDIWSLGCTVAEMLTGNRVWIYNDTKDLQRQIMNEEPLILGNVSEMAKDFIYNCWIKNPKRRWTSEQLLNHPFIKLSIWSKPMPEIQEVTTSVSPFGCQIPIPDKDFINLLFENSLKM